uniref:Uncharacterized protein n=1 Tax=Arundo donax TaxID=35708 RepID=A0A0A9ENX4_ARUDO
MPDSEEGIMSRGRNITLIHSYTAKVPITSKQVISISMPHLEDAT